MPPLWATAQSEKVKNIPSNRVIKFKQSMLVKEACATWHFSLILISLKEVNYPANYDGL